MQCSKGTGCNPSLDQLVGATKERKRHGEAERPSGLEVDDQLDPGGLSHRAGQLASRP